MSIPELPRGFGRDMGRVLADAVAVAASPFTLSEQVQDWGGRRWEFSGPVALSRGLEGRAVSAFFAQVGRAGKFILRDPSVRDVGDVGTPEVTDGGQTGTTLQTAGWTPSTTVLRAGDLFSVGAGATLRLYQVTADVASNAEGEAVLVFVPPLRESPAAEAALDVVTPGCVCRLSRPVPTEIARADKFRFTLACHEAL